LLKLFKHLKPFIWLIILIFGLLFGQAMADLSLPDLMSKIVNVGIQQNGIENATPKALTASKMDKVLLFASPDDRSFLKDSYILLSRESLSQEEYESYLKTYPALEEEPIYELNTTNGEAIERLSRVFENPLLAVSFFESGEADTLLAELGFPAGADPFEILPLLPSEQLDGIREAVNARIDGLPASIKTQSAIRYLADCYTGIGINLNNMQITYMVRIGGQMILMTLAAVSCSIAVGFLGARVAAGFGRNTRHKMFSKIEYFSNKEFDEFSTASLITRTTNDIQQIQTVLVFLLRIIFYAPIMGVGGIIKALAQDVSMSWIIAAAVAALLAMMAVIFAVVIPKFKIIQKLVDKLNLVTREMLSGLMVVRAFNNETYEEQKFDRANIELTSNTLFINRIMVFLMPAMMLIMNSVMLLIIWVGSHQVDTGAMQVGNMMAFMQYTMQIIFSFLMVSMVFIMLPRALVSAHRISEVLETPLNINDPESPNVFDRSGQSRLEFQNVGFKYPDADEYVLKDLSFTALPGQTTAIVGSTGSGKSTLIDLIPRFYDVTEGKILINNVDIRDVTQHDLRERIGYIPQKSVLFSGTIKSNISYGNDDAKEEDVKKAATIAQSLDFINATEDGLQSNVAPGGINFSGGQKQRLTIARAIAKQPDIYIFDDSFSALDFKTDTALRTALNKEVADATVLIVAQRISTIKNADQIIVLEKGRIAGKGTHSELMESCEVYREIALSQLTKGEALS